MPSKFTEIPVGSSPGVANYTSRA